ncbi:gamma-glutamylcyclotransferase family protein [Carnobacterium mobile]|uniref:gamma-glutamylcyclotransferase family protein n=1 Tax=Carnobacterium mobile TaxID=2750 RepID=UPI001868BA59|nr:gamma-glutamylcyclotransferase family protein [Carnobacterium mobile]
MQEEVFRPVFVYGSLKTGEFNYKRYLDGKVLTVEPKRARIKGKLYDMPYKGYPALQVEALSSDWVYGEVVELLDYETTLSQLDGLEGYYGAEHPANEYERSIKTVEVWQERTQEFIAQKAFVYLYRVENDARFTEQAQAVKDGIWRPSVTSNTVE